MRRGAALGLAAPFVVGCAAPVRPPLATRPKASVPALYAASAAELRPEAAPPAAATLRLGAKGNVTPVEFDATLSRSNVPPEVTLSLRTNGETLEREVYESSSGAFRAVGVGDDGFAPSLDLVRYPARDGDAWGWRGRLTYAGASRPADASVSLTRDGGDLRSDVRLHVSADPRLPRIERRLSFWFRKGGGVVGRSSGDVSRRPKGEAWRP